MTVEAAGIALGLGRAAAYRAVSRGQIPSLRIGSRLVIPTAALRRMLCIDATEAPEGASTVHPETIPMTSQDRSGGG